MFYQQIRQPTYTGNIKSKIGFFPIHLSKQQLNWPNWFACQFKKGFSRQANHSKHINTSSIFWLLIYFVPILCYLAVFNLRFMRFTLLNSNHCYYHQITQLIFPFSLSFFCSYSISVHCNFSLTPQSPSFSKILSMAALFLHLPKSLPAIFFSDLVRQLLPLILIFCIEVDRRLLLRIAQVT